jgi:hypothetical protein
VGDDSAEVIFDFFSSSVSSKTVHPQLSNNERENFLVGPFSSKQQDMKNEFYSLVSDDWIGDGDGIDRHVRRVRRRARTTFGKLLLFFSS